jgi:fructan beta-fructosidase
VSINPGGPNKGSATQYFVGDFDGKKFTASHTDIRWLDYGPDTYAGVTFSNTGDKVILIGWMNNWLYAGDLPTKTWKGAMTLPRELKLKRVGDKLFVRSELVPQIATLETKPVVAQNLVVSKSLDLATKTKKTSLPCRIDLDGLKQADFSVVASNAAGEELVVGYDKKLNQYYIDRTKSGKVDFQKEFSSRNVAPRLALGKTINLTLLLDVSSVELLADDGLTVLTAVYFPTKTFDRLHIKTPNSVSIKKLRYSALKPAIIH